MATDPSGSSETGLLDAGLAAWFALPIETLASPFAVLSLFVFGCLHALLPGHGKMLLAAHGATVEDGPARSAALVLDGVALATTRVLVAFALVIATVQVANALGFALPIATLRLLAGLALIGIGVHFAWHALFRPRTVRLGTAAAIAGSQGSDTNDGMRSSLTNSLVVLALTPEPVALAIASYGAVRNELPTAAVASLGMALGMGLTLGAASVLVAARARRVLRRGRLAVLPVAAVLVAAGAIVVLDAA